jgi:hypothetical protein
MFINLINFKSVSFLPSFVNSTKQEKLKIVISCLAFGILLLGTRYWTCSRFWASRRVGKGSLSKKVPKPNLRDDNKKNNPETSPRFSSVKVEQNGVDLSKKEILEEEEEQEKVLEPKPIDAVRSSPTSTSTATKVSICITTPFEVGLVGKGTLIPHITQFKLEDKSPIPLDEKDLLIPFHCFNSPAGCNLPYKFHLPKTLFADKNEDDFIRLYYNDQLFELYFHQNQHGLKFQEGTFEEVRSMAEIHNQENSYVLFGQFVRYPWYHGNGTVFKLQGATPNCLRLHSVSSDQFRPLQALIEKQLILEELNVDIARKDKQALIEKQLILEELNVDIARKDEGVYLTTDLTGFDATLPADLDQIQFVLYDRTLAIHALRKHKIDQFKQDYARILMREISDEYITGIRWRKIFTDIKPAEMQQKLENARLSLEFGVLQIFFPADS